MSTKKRVTIGRAEFDKLKRTGTMLSNICYNLSQSEERVPYVDDRERMSAQVKEWDLSVRDVIRSQKDKP